MKSRKLEDVQKSVENVLCFGVYENGNQIGVCCVVTDEVTFAYVLVFFIADRIRNRGIGKLLIEGMLSHSELSSARQLLATKGANGFYVKFGCREIEKLSRLIGVDSKSRQLTNKLSKGR